jgi:rhodanese-related sulfurtransferase
MRTVDHRDVLRMQPRGAQIVDVLPSHEFKNSHIVGAFHIPLAHIIRDAPKLLERTRPVVVYCRDSL